MSDPYQVDPEQTPTTPPPDDEEEGLDYTGTSGMDIVDGTEHDDTISTLGGTDVVAGGAGDDTIDGGAGNDFLFGDRAPTPSTAVKVTTSSWAAAATTR